MNVRQNQRNDADGIVDDNGSLIQPSIPCSGDSERQEEDLALDKDGRYWKNFLGKSLKFKRNILPQKQKYQWDCGVACCAMSLPSLQERHELYKNLEYYKEKLEFGTSTWTIDLCYILQNFNKSFTFYTNFPGVDPKFKSFYYYREILDKDTERVYKRFAEASQLGVSVSVRKVHLEEILEHVLLKGPAIVLTNANLLHCLDCSWTSSCFIFSCCLRKCFQGHYVLVTGFDLKNGWLYYNNPTYSDRGCRMYFDDFDKARTAPGTDGDLILITNTE